MSLMNEQEYLGLPGTRYALRVGLPSGYESDDSFHILGSKIAFAVGTLAILRSIPTRDKSYILTFSSPEERKAAKDRLSKVSLNEDPRTLLPVDDFQGRPGQVYITHDVGGLSPVDIRDAVRDLAMQNQSLAAQFRYTGLSLDESSQFRVFSIMNKNATGSKARAFVVVFEGTAPDMLEEVNIKDKECHFVVEGDRCYLCEGPDHFCIICTEQPQSIKITDHTFQLAGASWIPLIVPSSDEQVDPAQGSDDLPAETLTEKFQGLSTSETHAQHTTDQEEAGPSKSEFSVSEPGDNRSQKEEQTTSTKSNSSRQEASSSRPKARLAAFEPQQQLKAMTPTEMQNLSHPGTLEVHLPSRWRTQKYLPELKSAIEASIDGYFRLHGPYEGCLYVVTFRKEESSQRAAQTLSNHKIRLQGFGEVEVVVNRFRLPAELEVSTPTNTGGSSRGGRQKSRQAHSRPTPKGGAQARPESSKQAEQQSKPQPAPQPNDRPSEIWAFWKIKDFSKEDACAAIQRMANDEHKRRVQDGSTRPAPNQTISVADIISVVKDSTRIAGYAILFRGRGPSLSQTKIDILDKERKVFVQARNSCLLCREKGHSCLDCKDRKCKIRVDMESATGPVPLYTSEV